jgi:hypothetical protein
MARGTVPDSWHFLPVYFKDPDGNLFEVTSSGRAPRTFHEQYPSGATPPGESSLKFTFVHPARN